jgi:hypothetical protein
MTSLLPYSSKLSILIKPPDIIDLIRQFVTEHLPSLGSHILISSSENNLVGRQLGPIGKLHAIRKDFSNLLALLDLDLAIDNELGSTDIDVISSAALESIS